jgi:hypothetical protein
MGFLQTLARWIHIGAFILGAVGALLFLVRTRFWFPRYVHWMAAIALAIGLALLEIIPPDAPVNRGDWAVFKQTLVALLFPLAVYGAFVFYGGQRAAYHGRQRKALNCPHCGQRGGFAGDVCPHCGQTIPL